MLQAPPGAGKTTVVPLRLLDEPWLAGGRIVMLEPRRLATRAAARRMATLLGEDVGGTVGYRTRDERRTGPGDPHRGRDRRHPHPPPATGSVAPRHRPRHLRRVPRAQPPRRPRPGPDPRRPPRPPSRPASPGDVRHDRHGSRIAAACSGGAERVGGARHRQRGAGLAGRHPVRARRRRRPGRPGTRGGRARRPGRGPGRAGGDGRDPPGVAGGGRRSARVPAGGRGHPARRDGADGARVGPAGGVDVRPLYGALPIADQDAALAPSPPGRRRVVLSTDIAETSLTVDGVRVVVDGGWHRTPRYDPRSGLTRLETVGITKASADQRAGRAGRTEPGVAYRLWSKIEHARPPPLSRPRDRLRRPGRPRPRAGRVGRLKTDSAAVPGPAPAPSAGGGPAPPRRPRRPRRRRPPDRRRPGDGRTPTASPPGPHGGRRRRRPVGAARRALWPRLLEDRDVFRGRPDEIETDVATRLRLLLDRNVRHPQADGGAVAAARRRASELARRVGVPAPGENDELDPGPVLALAYPDRIAQARGGARFRLRGGGGGWLPADDPLSGEAFLVLAELDAAGRSSAASGKDSRIRLAAALDAEDVEAVAAATGATVERIATLSWDPTRDDLRARVERRLDNLVLGESEGPAEPGPATIAALLARVRATKLGILRWSDAARSLQARAAFARNAGPDSEVERIPHRKGGQSAQGSADSAAAVGEWPDLSDAALLGSLDDWLGPLLGKASSRADLEAIDMVMVLRRRARASASRTRPGRACRYYFRRRATGAADLRRRASGRRASACRTPSGRRCIRRSAEFRSCCPCYRRPADRSRSRQTCQASGMVHGRMSARTWPAAIPNTPGHPTPPQPCRDSGTHKRALCRAWLDKAHR